MKSLTKASFTLSGVFCLAVVGTLLYIWIGFSVFGLNTSPLDDKGPAWPMAVVVYSFIGFVITLLAGIVGAIITGRRTKPVPS